MTLVTKISMPISKAVRKAELERNSLKFINFVAKVEKKKEKKAND